MKLNFPPMPDLNEDFIYNLANQNMSASAMDLATGQAMAQDILNYRGEVDSVTAALETSVYLITSRDDEIKRLRGALKSVNEYIQELQEDAEDCHFCEDEGSCFTCGLLLSASDTIHKALEGK